MSQQFATRMNNLQPAAVYEIIKQIQGRDVVPFFVGNPGEEAIPTEEIAKVSADILAKNPITALQYGPSQGYEPLRKDLSAYLADKFGIGASGNDEIIITAGGTQAIELCARVFCNEGDTIITENPTFVGSLGSFHGLGLNLVGVDMQTDGMDLDQLEETLAREKNVKMIYVIPNFHNPTSWTMTHEKRKRLYDIAVKAGVLILEDDPYRDIRFVGEDVPTLKAMDTHGIVLYAGSFSKVISPGLRVGYLIVDKKYFAKTTACKQITDVHTTVLSQMIVHEFMVQFSLDKHIELISGIYKEKMQIMVDELRANLGENVNFVVPEGGLYVYCKLPDHIDVMEFYQKGIDAGVAIVYGSAFYVETDAKSQYFRLNFSAPSIEQIKKGIKILGEVMKQF